MQRSSSLAGPRPMHLSEDLKAMRTQVAYLRRMAAVISDPDTARSLLEIALQFEERLADLERRSAKEPARRAMARRIRRP
jgi:hypothetical protein